MATYTQDQKGRLLTTVFPAFRGDGSIGGAEVLEVTVDLSLVGSSTILGTASGFPNSGAGFAAADIFTVAVLPKNAQVLAVQFLLDTTAATPDVPTTGTGLTAATINVGDSGLATRFATGTNVFAANNALVYSTATQYYTANDVLNVTLASLTGATNVKTGKFRVRVHLVAFN